MASRAFTRVTHQLRQGVRGLAGEEFKAAQAAEEAHAGQTADLWKKISFFVAVPGMLACAYQAWNVEQEHKSHPRPEYIKYPHIMQRKTPFPWGDGNHSLFHGHMNPLPDGYED